MGAITEVVRRYVPGSYRAMVYGVSGAGTSYYQQSDVQSLADYVKFRLFHTAIAEASEAVIYDPLLLNFVGKLTTLQFIPAAVDYWGDQLLQETTTGTNEVVMFPDRRPELWHLFDRLRAEVQQDYDEMAETYGFRIYGQKGLLPQVSYGDNGRCVLRTEDPALFPRAFRRHRIGQDWGLVWTQGGS